jgi:hypothetical protein
MSEDYRREQIEQAASEIVAALVNSETLQHIRDERQRSVLAWAAATFGQGVAGDLGERAKRVAEEAIELAQAEGVPADALHALIAHVYAKAPGKYWQEAGGVGVTLLAYCERRGFSAESCEREEVARITSLGRDHFRARQNAKAAAGVARAAE